MKQEQWTGCLYSYMSEVLLLMAILDAAHTLKRELYKESRILTPIHQESW